MPSGDAETCLTPCSVLRQRSWAQVCEMLLDPEGRWLTSAHRKKERHRQTQSNTHRHGQRDPQTERHSDRETWRHRRWYGFGALVGVLRALSCSKSRYFPPEALLGSFLPPPLPQPWWTYPWQGLLLVQCTLGLESRVPGAVGEEGTAWGGRGWLRGFPETPRYSSWKDPITLTNSRPFSFLQGYCF